MTAAIASAFVNLRQFRLEMHVEEVIRRAWSLALGQPLSGGGLLEAVQLVSRTARSSAYVKIVDLMRLSAVVEPAVTNYQLQKAVEAEGLFYPPDPSSWRESFIGGNIALNAGGPRCVKYGNTKQFVMGLDFVTPTGEIIRSGGRVPKNATGFHLESLMIGSEGMLGIVTRCILRLLPLPEARRKFGTYADALALDQRIRSPRARALGWSPSLSSVTANVPRLFEEYRRAT